ncbi:MAG: iron-sulfur cluster carrier protein ApbC [Magnetococcales bacterium]|nr:iron-sulfur cluster carrier protein ApbC [Magnetococcales bacterium]NGZ25452.1 iron-sulfur cluster carrier protein ApbC [Magnetococcales bacterium]
MAAVTRDQVLQALRAVMDPDLHRDIVALGFVKDVEIHGGEVSFKVELTTPACPVKDRLKQQSHDVVAALPGVTQVQVTMTAQVRASKASANSALLPGVRNVVAVASGKGGVGKSTTAVNLALALQMTGARVGILDADIYGPSLPRMLNLQGKPKGLEDGSSKKLHPLEAYGLKAMSMGIFMPEDAPMIWRGPMVGMAVEQLLRDVEWGELDYLIVDLPPGTGDAQLTLTQKVPLTGAVIVSTPQDVALADVKKGIAMFRQVNVPILGLVENMSYYICPDCGHRAEIFSHGGARREANQAGIPFLGEVPLDEIIREVSDAGTPVLISKPDSPQAKTYQDIAAALASRIAVLNHQASKFPKIVVE